MKAMETIYDLIEEAKVRILWWSLCIFAISYFLTHTSKSIWMNIPIAIVFAFVLRVLSKEVDIRWKARPSGRLQTYLSHLERKQLSVNDPRLSNAPPRPKWKKKIDSPIVESAMNDFIDKILKDFVVDLWYSEITPDTEFPELIRATIMDVLAEISGRVKHLNVVDLLTRDIVDLIGDHLDLFRRNQASIGVEVMGTLTFEERDERLKYHLMASKELHPALISPESEYKVLQRLVGGLLAVVLNPREAQCPLIRSIARELVTCLVLQPIMNFASPGYINEVIEYILLAIAKYDWAEDMGGQSINTAGHHHDHSVAAGDAQHSDSTLKSHMPLTNQGTGMNLNVVDNQIKTGLDSKAFQEQLVQPQPADWARMLEAATQRRTEVLTPENLENMWTKGRNYKKKERKNVKIGVQKPISKVSGLNSAVPVRNSGKDSLVSRPGISAGSEERATVRQTPGLGVETQMTDANDNESQFSRDISKESTFETAHINDELEDTSNLGVNESKSGLKRSSSTSALKAQMDVKRPFTGECGGSIISEFYSPNFSRHSEKYKTNASSDIVLHSGGTLVPKLKCRVMGAYFEKLGSKSFAVYSIAVTDADNKTWFVKRRYSNFERLHRHLKDIPNYTLHLPPKRIFSSSTEDAFVHQRCIQLDKYLQDLLLIANVAEQHEVWDFLSASSNNYSFGKSSSVMRTLAVNVDDAVDDIVRQFKGVSDGLIRKVSGPPMSPYEGSLIPGRNLSWNSDDIIVKQLLRQNTTETGDSYSDHEEGDKDGCHDDEEVGCSAQAKGWHSDNELISIGIPPRVNKHIKVSRKKDSDKKHEVEVNSGWIGQGGNLEDPVGMPPEWTPPNVSVPLLNLVDNVFQLKRRGWLRRQVFWISKQILQLVMEDAIDDWLLRQIHWLRREDVIAQGIRWVQDVLWPDGTFFIKLRDFHNEADDSEPNQKSFQSTSQFGGIKVSKPGSFEQQLEAARRASDVKKMIFDGAPTALVSLIGHKQYRRCAKDIYYFLQSNICVKQLAYTILELLLVSVFPELRDLVLDIREEMRSQQPV